MRSRDHAHVLAIARDLPEWFTARGLEMMAFDLPRQHGLVATDPGQPIGFITYTLWKGIGYIGWMAIARAWHRTGIGRQLLEALEHGLLQRGTHALQVQTLGRGGTLDAYAGTRAFYVAMAFHEVQTYRCDDPDCPEILVLRKDLAVPASSPAPLKVNGHGPQPCAN